MINIIKESHDNEYKTIYTGTCGQCGSIIEFGQEDIQYFEWFGSGISCPVCRLRNIKASDCKTRKEKIEEGSMQYVQPRYNREIVLTGFCFAKCHGKPPRSKCESLGTCNEYDIFKKYLEGDEE